MKLGKKLYRGTIAVDIDGVLADFESKFCEDFGEDNRHMYSLAARYPEIDPELIEEWVKNPENYVDLAPIFGGLLFVRQAHQRGWYILLVTSRDKSLREVTRNWLAKYGVVYNEIMFTRAKALTIQDYDNLNPTRPVKIVVDDSVSVLESLPDKFSVAWEQPWNISFRPSMWYSEVEMRIILCTGDGSVRGIWDKAV